MEEVKRKGRPPKQPPAPARFPASLFKSALAKIAASPVEDVTASEFVARNAELFHEVFAEDRSPQEVVRKLKGELEGNGSWPGTEADLEELIAKGHREFARTSTAILSRPEPSSRNSSDKTDAATAGAVQAGGDSTLLSLTTERAEPSRPMFAARRATGLPDPGKPRPAVTSTGSIASGKAIGVPETSLPFPRPTDRLQLSSKPDDPAATGGPDVTGMLEEERRDDNPRDHSEVSLPEGPMGVVAQIAKGSATSDPDDGYEQYGSTDSG